MRRNGLSYGEILLKVPVSKGTISDWCKDIVLSDEHNARLLAKKLLGQRKGSIVAAQNKRAKRINHTREIFNEAIKEIGILSVRDRFIFGIALYAGEGTKFDGKGGFVNSNPTYIRFMSSWFQEFCSISLKDMRCSIWLHEENIEAEAKKYWSEVSGVPLKQFHKTYFVKNKLHSQKVRKNVHTHGVVSIKFYKSNTQRKIMGWISAFLNAKIAKLSNE